MGEEKQTHIVQPPRVIQRQPTPEEIAMMKASQERAVIEQKKARMIGVTATILSGIVSGSNETDPLITSANVNLAMGYACEIIDKVENHFKREGN